MPAKILTMDCETQRAIVETWDLWPNYIPIDNVIAPKRLLSFAAKWHDKEKVIFHAAWDDNDEDAFNKMVQAAWDLMNEADIIVGWNSTRYDIPFFNAAFGRLGLGPPSPSKSLDLMQVAKKNFKAGELSMKLDWFSKMWLDDRKVNHSATDIWHDIRYGNRAERRAAQKLMKTYNKHDVVLTEKLFDRFKPWTGVNFALYENEDSGVMRCTKCASENLVKRGFFYTTTFSYQRYFCNDCGGWSKGPKRVYTTELRPL